MKITTILMFLSLAALDAKAGVDIHSWAKVDRPTQSLSAKSIGKVTAGCLRGAVALPINGDGYQVMRLSRKRYYGHPDLISFITGLGRISLSQGLGTLLIGDLGQPRGGPTLTGHRSHQTGLDVDIWYWLNPEANKRELNPNERESWGAPSVVNTLLGSVDPLQWSLANEKVLEIAAGLPNVDRIFVNAYIKKAMCGRQGKRDWLQKIRPWFAHADHFHVRLKCPIGSNNCDKQEPVPQGDGCGADLAWWFSEDAKKPAKKTPPSKVVLPAECDGVFKD